MSLEKNIGDGKTIKEAIILQFVSYNVSSNISMS
jgi:hypothetical protein